MYAYHFRLATSLKIQNIIGFSRASETTYVICLNSFGVLNKWGVYLKKVWIYDLLRGMSRVIKENSSSRKLLRLTYL